MAASCSRRCLVAYPGDAAMSADSSRTQLPPGPRLPGPSRRCATPSTSRASSRQQRERYGPTWTLRLPGFPPAVVTTDRDAIKRLFTGDPLTKRHGNDLLRPFLGDRSLIVLEPDEHLARRRLELPPFHGERSAPTPPSAARRGRGRGLAHRRHGRRPSARATADAGGDPRTRARRARRPRAPAARTAVRLLRLGQQPRAVRADWITRRSCWNLPARCAYARIDRVRALLKPRSRAPARPRLRAAKTSSRSGARSRRERRHA